MCIKLAQKGNVVIWTCYN